MPTRRITITLRRGPWLGVRPTIVMAGRGQPAQWGSGTWQVDADEPATIAVYLHWRGITWGRATITTDATTVDYRAPWLPFGRGTIAPR